MPRTWEGLTKIYYDNLQEVRWFQSLDNRFSRLETEAFPTNLPDNHPIKSLLKYDRPDIILIIRGQPLLVIERSEEVPSGHNVGQRFGRLLAAAEANVPCLYFFPFVARKHGGDTAGPRYVNLRLFYTLDKVFEGLGTELGIITWPVDSDAELIRTPVKDALVKRYVKIIMDFHDNSGNVPTWGDLVRDPIHRQMKREIQAACDSAPRKDTIYFFISNNECNISPILEPF